MSFFSVVLGILLAAMASPFFDQVIGKSIAIPLDEPGFYGIMLLFAIAIGMLSGLYPALFLSRIKTVSVLGGKSKAVGKGSVASVRGVLVVFQFAISMFLIAGALIVFKQMDFILSKDLGFNKEQVLMINGMGPMNEGMLTFKESLEQFPDVVSASFSNYLPVEGTARDGNGFWKEGRRNIDNAVPGQFWGADEDYFETLGIEIVEGRVFSQNRVGDSLAVVVNEAMVRELGLEDPIDAIIENWLPWKIVGVMKDFNYDHLSEEVRPLLIARRTQADVLAVKLKAKPSLK